MQRENYINIQGWMISDLNLSGNELILYALIYGFSQDGISEFYGSLSYIESFLHISRPTAISLLRKLTDKSLIENTTESHYKVVKKLYHPSKETLPVASKETLPNIYNTNNNTNTDFFSKNPSLSNSFVSPEKLTTLEVKNKTHKDFANALRAEKGNPPLEVKKLTLNQIDFFARSKLIDYYKQAVNSKYNKNYFTNPLDISDIKKENSKMSMMIKIFYQRCGDDKIARDVIDYYAGDYGKFFEWKPNGLFRKDTIIDFENRKNKPNKNNTIKLYGKEWQF